MKGPMTDRRLRIAIAGLCLIGIGIGGYLTYVHYAGLHVLCLAHRGCETVQNSRYSKLDGVTAKSSPSTPSANGASEARCC